MVAAPFVRPGQAVEKTDERDLVAKDKGLHRVWVSAGCVAAVSLHVYAAPIDACLVFDEERDRCGLKRLRYDAIARL